MPDQVVAELARQVVDAFFFNQSVGSIVGKLVNGIVFLDQRGQADGLVVFVANALALGVPTAARQATSGAQQARGNAIKSIQSKNHADTDYPTNSSHH